MSTVIAIKLTNGEEWIGKHMQTMDSTTVTLGDPRKVQVVPNGRGQVGIGLMPIFICANDLKSITVDVNSIVASIEVDHDFAKQYLQEVTGIQLV